MGQAEATGTRTNRFGAGIAVLVNVVGLLVLHLWPGWEAFAFLTDQTHEVLGIVDAALVVGIVVNLVLLLRTSAWPIAAGNLVTSVVSLVAVARVLQVFPFDLSDGWSTIVRAVLVFGVVGASLGVLALLASLLRLRQVERR